MGSLYMLLAVLELCIEEYSVTDVLLVMPSATRFRRSEIIAMLEPYRVHVKHVRMVEKNPLEAISNSILGTYCTAKAAINSKVDTFVLISTDKAVRPGITGLAQINNIDMFTPKKLARTDAQMLQTLSVKKYIRYIVLTLLGKGVGDRVIN